MDFIKINAILSFSLNFFKRNKNFSSKLILRLCQLHQQSKSFTTSILMKNY